MSQTKEVYPGHIAKALHAVRVALLQADLPEGLVVCRVGMSRTIALEYRSNYTKRARLQAIKRVAEASAFLRSLGFPFDHRGWMSCRIGDHSE